METVVSSTVIDRSDPNRITVIYPNGKKMSWIEEARVFIAKHGFYACRTDIGLVNLPKTQLLVYALKGGGIVATKDTFCWFSKKEIAEMKAISQRINDHLAKYPEMNCLLRERSQYGPTKNRAVVFLH